VDRNDNLGGVHHRLCEKVTGKTEKDRGGAKIQKIHSIILIKTSQQWDVFLFCFIIISMSSTKSIGNFGEQLACDYLARHGYLIVGRNVKIGRRELDIIASLPGRLIFVEVKTLCSLSIAAEDALSRRQISIIKIAINQYCGQHRLRLTDTRFDFISVNLNRQTRLAKIRHYQNIY